MTSLRIVTSTDRPAPDTSRPSVPSPDEPRTVQEWRVTGEPGPIRTGHSEIDKEGAVRYPPYLFVFRSDDPRWPGDQAEAEARRFHGDDRHEWEEGPFLHHRVVTYSGWEPAE